VVRLSDVVSEAASRGGGQFVVSEVMFEYQGGEVWLSGTLNGRGELQMATDSPHPPTPFEGRFFIE
jgi:hypothetical protein